MIEREIKAMLTEGEYITLARFKCQHKAVNLQTNYYFDTDDLSMNEKGITCRIRHKNGRYKAVFDRMSELRSKVTDKSNEKDSV